MSTPNEQDPALSGGQGDQTPPLSQPTSPNGTDPSSVQTPPTEDIEALRAAAARANQLEAELGQIKQNYDHLRTDHTRKSQALAQLTGANQAPPQDPLSPFLQKAAAKGYNPEDARFMAEMVQEMVAPLAQQQQQYYGALQATQQVGDVMRAAWTQEPEIFADPRVSQQVEAQLKQNAMTGQSCEPALAVNLAILASHQLRKQGNQAPPAQQWQPPSFGGFTGMPGGFAPQAPAKQQANPMADDLYQKMQKYSGIPKQA